MKKFHPEHLYIGISTCLLGEPVRYNGGHKASNFCLHQLKPFVTYEPICPEVAIGMGVPRPSIRLVKQGDSIRVLGNKGTLDVTEDLVNFSNNIMPDLKHLSGYIVCQKSPSCGMERVVEYSDTTGSGTKTGMGVFTRVLIKNYPLLPVEEDGRLNDPILRENFFTRVYAHHAWQCLIEAGITKKSLIDFHSRYKYLVMSHSTPDYKVMGRILSDIKDLYEVKEIYFQALMGSLAKRATRKSHTNTLQHIQGYFKHKLTVEQKKEFTETILKYRAGIVPLLVPITLIQHHLLMHPIPYIKNQVYLAPYPEQLKLRYGY